jgi:tight adherence protein C
MSAVIAFFAFISVLLVIAGVQRYTAPRLGQQMVQRMGEERDLISRQRGFFEKHLRPTVEKLPRYFGFLKGLQDADDVRLKLAYAGHPLGLDAERFFGLRVLVALAVLILGFYYNLLGLCGGPILLIGAPIGGFFAPLLWLNRRVKARQDEITLSLPYMLDLLSVCVQAGMGFERALQNIVEHMTGPLSEELRHFLRELRLGESRETAFRHLAERNSSEELRAFGNAMIQADELGTPISQTLRIHAEDMRVRRQQRAKELASKASPKISLVAISLIAPSAMLLMLGALVLSALFGGGLSVSSGSVP